MSKKEITRFIVKEMNQTIENVLKGVIPELQAIGSLSALSQLAAAQRDLTLMERIRRKIQMIRDGKAVAQ